MLEDKASAEAQRLFEATIKFEHASLRPLYLLNGGAAVAVIAFAGGAPEFAAFMVTPIKYWIFGLVFAALATFAGYFSQYYFYKRQGRLDEGDKNEAEAFGKSGTNCRRVAYFSGAASLFCFCVGALAAVDALSKVSLG